MSSLEALNGFELERTVPEDAFNLYFSYLMRSKVFAGPPPKSFAINCTPAAATSFSLRICCDQNICKRLCIWLAANVPE